jgi:catechol 2,3-dioxygenase-like lactoylglutathione lyase family enzyme
LNLLGRFLEYSLPTPDIQASLDFYLRLGLSEATAGETWSHPYAVVTDGRISLGLHQLAEAEPTLTFVKPRLLQHLPEFEALGIEFDVRRLGNDVFNEVGWRDPTGQRVRLIEARTFSPAKRSSEFSKLGYFMEIAGPAVSMEVSKLYWEQLGFVGMDELDSPLPHITCTSDHIDLGLYEPHAIRPGTLRFEVDEVRATLASLKEIGVEPAGVVPAALRGPNAALLKAPEGTPLLLTAAS